MYDCTYILSYEQKCGTFLCERFVHVVVVGMLNLRPFVADRTRILIICINEACHTDAYFLSSLTTKNVYDTSSAVLEMHIGLRSGEVVHCTLDLPFSIPYYGRCMKDQSSPALQSTVIFFF